MRTKGLFHEGESHGKTNSSMLLRLKVRSFGRPNVCTQFLQHILHLPGVQLTLD